jgi:hypothetical protein
MYRQQEFVMSSIRFVKAPPCPIDTEEKVWISEWLGLIVKLDPVFIETIGYLGEGEARIYDSTTHRFRESTSEEAMKFVTRSLSKFVWISRISLEDSCSSSKPSRPTIFAWLAVTQGGKDMFAVPISMVEYLPEI